MTKAAQTLGDWLGAGGGRCSSSGRMWNQDICVLMGTTRACLDNNVKDSEEREVKIQTGRGWPVSMRRQKLWSTCGKSGPDVGHFVFPLTVLSQAFPQPLPPSRIFYKHWFSGILTSASSHCKLFNHSDFSLFSLQVFQSLQSLLGLWLPTIAHHSQISIFLCRVGVCPAADWTSSPGCFWTLVHCWSQLVPAWTSSQEPTVSLSSQLLIQWGHVDSSNIIIVLGVFTPWKSAYAWDRGSPSLQSWLLKPWPHSTVYRCLTKHIQNWSNLLPPHPILPSPTPPLSLLAQITAPPSTQELLTSSCLISKG